MPGALHVIHIAHLAAIGLAESVTAPGAATGSAAAAVNVGGGWGAYLLSTLLALGVALALAWVVIRLLPRLFGGRAGRAVATQGVLEVMARLPLEPRRTLYLVKAPGAWLLLGSGENGFERIAELDGDAVNAAMAEARARGAEGPSLATVLHRLSGGRIGGDAGEAGEAGPGSAP